MFNLFVCMYVVGRVCSPCLCKCFMGLEKQYTPIGLCMSSINRKIYTHILKLVLYSLYLLPSCLFLPLFSLKYYLVAIIYL